MDDIDWEALAQAGYYAQFPLGESWGREHIMWRDALRKSARAVVAAYREQQRTRGVVEVPASELRRALDWLERGYDLHPEEFSALTKAVRDQEGEG